MGAHFWLVVFLACLGLRAVTPVEDRPQEFDQFHHELMGDLDFDSDSDQFHLELMRDLNFHSDLDHYISMSLDVPCATHDSEFKQFIEPHSNPTKELPSFSPQTVSVVENRPTGKVTESDPLPSTTIRDIFADQLQSTQPPHIPPPSHAFQVVTQGFPPISGVSTSRLSPDTCKHVSETRSKRVRPDVLEGHQAPNLQQSHYAVRNKSYRPRYHDTRAAFDKSLKLVDFNPLKTSGQIAVEAIASLKEASGRKLISIDTLKEGGQKMVRLDPPNSNMDDFYRLARTLITSHKPPSENSKACNKNVITTSGGQPRNAKLAVRSTFTSVLRQLSQSNNPKIKFYTQNWINYEQKDTKLKRKLQERFSKDKNKLKRYLAKWKYMMATMPVYLFYVDMINIMIPKGALIDENLIDDQRNVAMSNFLEFTEKLLLEESTWTNPLREEKEELPLLKDNIPYIRDNKTLSEKANTFAWRAIHYWLISSRRELLVDQRSLVDGPSQFFKIFFRKLLESWLENH